jgi:hypothetical protein
MPRSTVGAESPRVRRAKREAAETTVGGESTLARHNQGGRTTRG